MWSILAFVAAAIQGGNPGFSAPELPAWDEAWARGREALEEGALEDALSSLETARGLNPWEPSLARTLSRARDRLARRLVEEARALEAKGRTFSARRRWVEAAGVRAGKETRDALRRHGLRRYGDEWLFREDIARRERDEEHRARRRRLALDLPSSFRLERRRSLRIWTDHRDPALVPLARRLLDLLDRQIELFVRLFSPLEPELSEEGIDIAVFSRREDYEAYTGRDGSAGVFLPEKTLSCFHLAAGEAREREESFVRGVFLHEVSHQLEVRLLRVDRVPRWLQEGLAMEVERLGAAGALGESDLRQLLEVPVPDGLGERLAACGPESDSWPGLEAVCRTGAGEILAADAERRRDYYARSWALVHFLLHESPLTRSMFFELVVALREADSRAPRRPGDLFGKVLHRYAHTYETIERRFERHVRRVVGGDGDERE